MRSALALALALLSGCAASSPPRTSEETCRASCNARATVCSKDDCDRGCNFVLDRLVEGQADEVISCVATGASCDDRAWARCAVRLGVHADGGPPAPPPAPEDD